MSYPNDPYRRPNPPQVTPRPQTGQGHGAPPGTGSGQPGGPFAGQPGGQQQPNPGADGYPGGPQRPSGPGGPGPSGAPGHPGASGPGRPGAPGPQHPGTAHPGNAQPGYPGAPQSSGPGSTGGPGGPGGYPGASPASGYPGASPASGYPGSPSGPGHPGAPGYPGGPGGPPPKKKRTGLFIGLGIGAFLVLALIVGGGLWAGSTFLNASEPEPSESAVAEPTQDPTQEPTQEPTQDAAGEPDLAVGDCIANPDVTTALQTVECDQPHFAQVYAQQEIDGDTYPGTSTLTADAQAFCESGTAGALDPAKLSSDFAASYVIPTAETWGQNDRHIHCLVHRADKGDFTENLLPSS